MSDEQTYCLACGEPVGRVGRICDDCLWDEREMDYDIPVEKEGRG